MKRVIDNLYTRGGGNAQERISELKRVLGLGTAAYTAVTAYIGHALATAANDFLVASGSGTFVKKTVEETRVILNKLYEAQETVSSEGESELTLSIDSYLSIIGIDSSGDVFILPDGTVTGQLKKILAFVEEECTGAVIGTFGSDVGTLNFSSTGQFVLFQWDGLQWVALELGSVSKPDDCPAFSS